MSITSPCIFFVILISHDIPHLSASHISSVMEWSVDVTVDPLPAQEANCMKRPHQHKLYMARSVLSFCGLAFERAWFFNRFLGRL
jgi:hypothetical protein